MCLTCGCHEPYESHGNPDNFTMEGLQRAAKAAGITVQEAAANIQADTERRTDLGEVTVGEPPHEDAKGLADNDMSLGGDLLSDPEGSD
jgi:hypothetical protein